MKRKIIFCALFLFSCSYGERSTWDSGGEAERTYEQQRQEEVDDGVDDGIPQPGVPHTENPQPF